MDTFKLHSLLSETEIIRSKCVLGQQHLKLCLFWNSMVSEQEEGSQRACLATRGGAFYFHILCSCAS